MARLIAIDLGAYSVKVTSLTGSGTVHELEGHYHQRVPLGEDGRSSKEDRLASLDLLLRQHGDWMSVSRIVELILDSSELSHHHLQLPFDDATQIEQTLPFAVESEVPYDLDDYVLGWRKTASAGEVAVVLSKQDPLEVLLKGLESRAMDPRAVRCDGEMLARYATDPEHVTAVIDVGHEHTTIGIGRAGVSLWVCSIDTAGAAFTRAIQGALDCEWGEAEALKHGDEEQTVSEESPVVDYEVTDPSFGTRLPSKAREPLNNVLGLFLAEVRASLIRAEDQLGVGIDDVVLSGDGSRIPELRTHLEQDLGVPLRGAHDAEGMPVRPSFAASSALAWRMSDDSASETVDLRVGDLAYQGGMDLTRAIMTYGGAGVGFFLAAVVMMFAWQYRVLSQEYAAVEANIEAALITADPAYDGLIGGMDSTMMASEFASLVAAASEEAELLGDSTEIPETVDLVYRVTKAFPAHPTVKVNIDELDVNPGAIRLQGATDGFTQVDAIADSLRAGGQFTKVTQDPGQRNSKGFLNFTINIDRSTDDEDDESDVGEEG
jgi:general secretion pathway protein L